MCDINPSYVTRLIQMCDDSENRVVRRDVLTKGHKEGRTYEGMCVTRLRQMCEENAESERARKYIYINAYTNRESVRARTHVRARAREREQETESKRVRARANDRERRQ